MPETQSEFFDQPSWQPELRGTSNARTQGFIVDTQGATGGTFDLTMGGSTYSGLAWNISNTALQAAISGSTVTGRVGLWSILFTTSPLEGTIDATNLTGTPAGQIVITQSGAPDTSESPELPETEGDEAEDVTITVDTTAYFTFDVRDNDDALVRTLADVLEGSRLRLEVDQASTLTFRIPGDSAAANDIVPPNRIVLRDAAGFVVEAFDIVRRTYERPGEAYFLNVFCMSVLGRLATDPIIEYNETRTAAAHVAALLALQERTQAITVGTIAPQIASQSIALRLSDTSILGAIKALQNALTVGTGGHFYVDARNRFQWPTQIGDHTGTIIAIGRGLQSVTYEVDYSEQVNRLYIYGEGLDHANRVKLTDIDPDTEAATWPTEYYQDATSIATYDVRTFRKVDRRVRYAATLLRIAKRIVNDFKDPVVSIDIGALDLSKAINFTGFPELYIGSEYRVVDPYQSIDTTVTVTALEIDIDNPMTPRIELVNRRRSLGDVLGSLVDQLTAIDLDVNDDGSRYPTIARTFTAENDPAYADLAHKAGDTLVSGGELYMHDGTAFRELGATSGGVAPAIYSAASAAALPSGVVAHALGYTTSQGVWYGRNSGNDSWLPISRWVDTEA